jgi:Cu-processing system ATP-binding protein
MIEISEIAKKFGKLSVLNDINLHLSKGQCIALIGPNGCGKTTLIKCILGMVLPNKGEIFFSKNPYLKTLHTEVKLAICRK